MDFQDLAYAVTQIVHNFGAVAVVGGAAAALVWREAGVQRRLAWMVFTGWSVQALSGATFGAISYYYYAKFPDIFGIAMTALIVKVVCAAAGIALASSQLIARFSEEANRRAWIALCGLGVLALCSAAVLRWFS
ncbi:MAG: hypothetical protein ABI479_07600 [Gallionella sp.]